MRALYTSLACLALAMVGWITWNKMEARRAEVMRRPLPEVRRIDPDRHLVACRACGRKISKRATECPGCGEPRGDF